MPQMDDDDLKAILGQEIKNAQGYLGGDLSDERATAMDYYLGKPFGDEREGRSQIVMRVVHDVVEGTLPEILEMVAGGDDVVQFEPVGPEDEEQAKQATDYVNHIIMKDNDGFRILHDCAKDGLLQKTGCIKIYTEDYPRTEVKTLTGLSDDEMALLFSDKDEDEIEPLAHSERQVFLPGPPDPMTGQPTPVPGIVHDLTVRRTSKTKKVCIENIPPDELLVSRQERSWDNPRFIAHRTTKTKSDLREMGIPEEIIARLPTDKGTTLNVEQLSRSSTDDIWASAGSKDETTHEVEVIEAYIRVDYDGDGIAEYRRVVAAAAGGREAAVEILDNEEVDDHPFAGWSPIRIPHTFHGMSQAEQVMDLQLVDSTVMRQTLDNTYGINSGRMIVAESGSTTETLDDILANRPDGIIRAKTVDAVFPVPVQSIIQHTMAVLEKTAAIREERTGHTRYNQGTDANSLNKTARGIGMIMTAAQKRKIMIARMFAEMCLKTLCKKVLKEVVTNQDRPRVIRLRNKWVNIDPRWWNSDMDLSVNVGLGYGTREAQSAQLTEVLQIQNQIIEMQGGFGGLVSPDNVYNVLEKKLNAVGFRNAEPYFSRPGTVPPPEPKPDPAMMKVEAEKEKIKAQIEGNQQITQTKVEGAIATTQAKIQGDQMKAQSDVEIAREKAKADIEGQHQQQEANVALAVRDQDLKFKAGGYSRPEPKAGGKDKQK